MAFQPPSLLAQDSVNPYQIDPEDWKTGSGIWSRSEEGYFQKTKVGLSLLGLFHHKVKDVIIQYDYKFERGAQAGAWAGISFQKSDPMNEFGEGGYLVYLRVNGNMELFQGNQVLQTVPTGIDTSKSSHVKISVIQQSLTVCLNSASEPQLGAKLSIKHAGYIDLETTGVSAQFDSFTIAKPDDD